jgi:hypothetical protein
MSKVGKYVARIRQESWVRWAHMYSLTVKVCWRSSRQGVFAMQSVPGGVWHRTASDFLFGHPVDSLAG